MQSDCSDDIDYDALVAESAAAAQPSKEIPEEDDGPVTTTQKGLHKLQAQTLRELASGVNRDAAIQQMEDKVYLIAVLMNFMAMRLVTTSGGRPPHIFDSETRQ
jgi:hypothetical protein